MLTNQLERQSFKHRYFEKNQRKRTTILQGNSTTETRLCWTHIKRTWW